MSLSVAGEYFWPCHDFGWRRGVLSMFSELSTLALGGLRDSCEACRLSIELLSFNAAVAVGTS